MQKKRAVRIVSVLATLFFVAGAVPYTLPEFNATTKMIEVTRGLHDATITCASWWKKEDPGWVMCTAVGRIHDRDAEDEALVETFRRKTIPRKLPNRWLHLAIEARCPAFVWAKEHCVITKFSKTGTSGDERWY